MRELLRANEAAFKTPAQGMKRHIAPCAHSRRSFRR